MKTLIKKVKEIIAKVKAFYKTTKVFIVDTQGMFKSVWICLFRTIKKPGIFYGHYAYELAQYFARRRDKRWKAHWDQDGKLQGIIPLGETKIIVCSRMEARVFQRNGLIDKRVSVNKFFKKATYYKTKRYYGHTE